MLLFGSNMGFRWRWSLFTAFRSVCLIRKRHQKGFTYFIPRGSERQWAAVRMCRWSISAPPHQNSLPFGLSRKIAAIHGHSPDRASSPPTIRASRPDSPHSLLASLFVVLLILLWISFWLLLPVKAWAVIGDEGTSCSHVCTGFFVIGGAAVVVVVVDVVVAAGLVAWKIGLLVTIPIWDTFTGLFKMLPGWKEICPGSGLLLKGGCITCALTWDWLVVVVVDCDCDCVWGDDGTEDGWLMDGGMSGGVTGRGMVAAGQQTPGTTKFLKQTDCLIFSTLNMSHMHLRMSLHSPGNPSGVRQKLIVGRTLNRFGTIPIRVWQMVSLWLMDQQMYSHCRPSRSSDPMAVKIKQVVRMNQRRRTRGTSRSLNNLTLKKLLTHMCDIQWDECLGRFVWWWHMQFIWLLDNSDPLSCDVCLWFTCSSLDVKDCEFWIILVSVSFVCASYPTRVRLNWLMLYCYCWVWSGMNFLGGWNIVPDTKRTKRNVFCCLCDGWKQNPVPETE